MKYNSWNSIDWFYVTNKVNNLQIKIYEASKIGNLTKVHMYQNTLTNLYEAKLLSVRKVTQDNRGKRTAGVDSIKILNAKDRMELADKLKIDGKASPIKRIWIPKPGKTEKRPLGIPTMEDRVKQQLVKYALEPQWEAKFDEGSYGFRPGRSTMDAVNHAYHCIWFGEVFVLNGDIRKCFDRISHIKLLNKIQSTRTINEQIHAWLKAGILDSENNTKIVENDQGTPQGGVISPLLCNIALNGLEEFCRKAIRPTLKSLKISLSDYRKRLHVIRFADDFIVTHPKLEAIQEMQKHIKTFLLDEMDLELNEEKTFICSTLNPITLNNKVIKPGFLFLGFSFKTFYSKTYPAKNPGGHKIGCRPKLKPSFEAISSHVSHLKTTVKKYRGISQSGLISKLAPIITGWSNYYKFCSASQAFSYCDNALFFILYSWALRRHNNKSRKWVLEKYFHAYKKRKYVFSCYPDNTNIKTMPFHVTRKIETYHRTKKSFSPFFSEQLIKVENLKLNKTSKNLFKRQSGYCRWCLAPFRPGDVFEIHHIHGKNHPKREYEIYKWLVHGHCHDELHREFKGTEFPYLKKT